MTQFYTLLLLCSITSAAYSQESVFSFGLKRQDAKSIITLNTIKKFPCKNYLMDTRDYQNADTIIIVVKDFMPPSPCSGPRSEIEEKFIYVPSAKRFYIKLWYKGKFDEWRVFQLDTAYLVRPEGVTFSKYLEEKN